MHDMDVIVVGGGPAGALCAYELARGGVRVAVVEQAALPRYKPCGGGLTWKAARRLPFPIQRVVEREIRGLTLSYRLGETRSFYAARPLGYTVMRDRFDHYLIQQAHTAGARIFDGEAVVAVEHAPGGVRVVTRGRTLHARALVGADGAKGVVARQVGLNPITLRGVAIESEVRLGATVADARAIPLNTLGLDFYNSAEDQLDYAWVFPKAHVLSVGAAGHERAGGAIKDYWQAYFQGRGLRPEDVVRTIGHTLPCRLTRAPLVAGRVVLAGDAAGMVEPFTGEGIGYALQSGCIAAEVLLQHLDGHLPDMQAYQRRVDAEILPELRRAYALARVARRVPRLTYLAFVHLPRFRNLVYGLMRGERSFGCASPKLRPVEPLLRRLEP